MSVTAHTSKKEVIPEELLSQLTLRQKIEWAYNYYIQKHFGITPKKYQLEHYQ